MKKFNKLLNCYLFVFKHQIFAYVLLSMFAIVPIISITVLNHFYHEILVHYSFILSVINQIILLVLMIYLGLKLFHENNYNMSDIKFIGKSYRRYEIYWAKYTFGIIVSLIATAILSLVSSIMYAIIQLSGTLIAAMVVSNLIGMIMNCLFFLPLVILICNVFKGIVVPAIMSVVVLGMFPTTGIIANLYTGDAQQSNNLDLNFNNQDALVQYAKIYGFNASNALVDSTYAYSINNDKGTTLNLNRDFDNNINYQNKWSVLSPSNVTMSFQAAIFAKMDQEELISNLTDYQHYSTSLVRYTVSQIHDISKFLNQNQTYVLTNGTDGTIFELQTQNLQARIISDLNQLMDNPKFKPFLQDPTWFDAISKKLNDNQVWNFDNLDSDQQAIVKELLGMSNPDFFYLWFYQNVLVGNLGNLYDTISHDCGQGMSNLTKVLWAGPNTYFNIMLVHKGTCLTQLYNTLIQKYPVNVSVSSDINASQRDIDFFCNYLVRVPEPISAANSSDNGANASHPDLVYILDANGIYQPINKQDFMSKFHLQNLTNQADWITYLTQQNIPSSGFLKKTYEQLKTLLSDIVNIYNYQIQNTTFNINTFNGCFQIESVPVVAQSTAFMIVQILFIGLWTFSSYYTYIKLRLE